MANIPQPELQAEAVKVIFLDNVPESLHTRVKVAAAANRLTLKAFVLDILFQAMSPDDKRVGKERGPHER